jgi:hypothetical protein
VPGLRQCLDLSPGAIITNRQTIINIAWIYIIPDFFEPIDPYTAYRGLYTWDASFYGFYTNDKDRLTADVTQGSVVGSTLITFTRKTSTDVNSNSCTSFSPNSMLLSQLVSS